PGPQKWGTISPTRSAERQFGRRPRHADPGFVRRRRVPRVAAGVGALALVASLVAVAPSATAYHNEAGQGRHWGRLAGTAQATPGVRDQTGQADWGTQIGNALNSWNATPHVQFGYILGGAASCDAANPTYAGVTACLRSPLPCGNTTNAAGCTFAGTLVSPNHFGRVVIQFNPQFITTSAQRRNTACHEFGHALGLAHRTESPTPATCMLTAQSGNLVGDQHDFDQILFMTNHTH
ncbi:MAG: hypothetical protein WD232_04250, partial [Acidimicrobiales bacterium]